MDKFTQERIDRTRAAAEALSTHIHHYFDHLLPGLDGISISCEEKDRTLSKEGEEITLPLQFVLPDGALLRGSVSACNVGGNMYEFDATVADNSERFTVSLPDPVNAGDVQYADRVTDYLYEEIKRAAGEEHLRSSSSE